MTVLDPVKIDTIQPDEVSVDLNVVWHGSLEIGTLCLETWHVVKTQQPGMGLPCGQWNLLNRFRTDEGPCSNSMHEWGYIASPLCDCGEQLPMRLALTSASQKYYI